MRNLHLAAFAALFVAGSPVYAADGVYLGVSFGPSKVGDLCEDIVGDCEDLSTGWKVYVGGQLDPNWGVEAAYVNLGEFTATDTSGVPTDLTAEVVGLNMAVVGTLPVAGAFAILGKLGVFMSNLDIAVSGGGISGSDSASGIGVSMGLGTKLAINDRAFARLEWERFADIGNEDTGEDDVDLFSVGLGVNF